MTTAVTENVVRQAIEPEQILTLKDFCYRAAITRYGWSSMLRRAVEGNYEISFVSGRNVYVDTTEWIRFLKETGKRK